MNAMLSRLFVIVALLMIGIPDPTSAQDSYVDGQTGQSMILQYKVGGYGGALLNMHNVSFGALPGYASCCTSFENTALPGLAAGVLGEYRIDESMVLDGRFGYSTLSATFQRNQLIGNEPVLTDGPVGTPDRRDVVVQHVLSSSIALITLEPTLRYGISGKMSVIGGIRAGYALGPTFEQQEILISPEGYVFADGSAVRNQQSGVLPTATTVNLHATVGAHYELFKSQTYSFGLDLRYYYPITDVAAVDWSVQALHAGMSIAFGVY